MIEIVNGIILISLVIIIYKYFEKLSYDVVMVKSQTNGKSYLVRNLEDKQEAANLIGTIAIKLEKLVEIIKTMGYEQIYEQYMKDELIKENSATSKVKTNNLIEGKNSENNDTQILETNIKMKLKDDIDRLIKNFNSDAFSETTPDAKYTSYSVNKGEKVVFCLRQKKDGEELVKQNILTFVALHELSHLFTKSIGHEPEFWNNFKLILKIAIDNGLYKDVDFNNTPKEYCGISISDSPLKK